MNKKIDYRRFMQNDPRNNEQEAWPEERFPDAQYRYLSEAGCLVCSLAFLLRYHEFEKEANTEVFNPWTFCEALIQNQAFSSAADLEVAAVSRLYPIGYLGVMEYSREKLIDAVRQGYACLLVVKGKNGPFHFIVLEELTEEDAIVFDSSLGQRYLSEYEAVYQIRLFCRMDHIKTGAEIVFGAYRDRPDGIQPGKIAISFDDGPEENSTERVLNILEANDVKASFFVLGEALEKHEMIMRRMVQAGHQVGIHGWNHLYLNAMGEETCRSNLDRAVKEIRRVCDGNPTVLRPPGGYADGAVLKVAEELGLAVIGWTVDPGDWQHNRKAQEVVEAVLSEVSAGDIVLLHDIRTVTLDALEILIPELKRRGLQPVTLDELAAESGGLVQGSVYNWIG